MRYCHSERSRGDYLNSHPRRRFHILEFLYSCILIFLVDKMNATCGPLKTQNKPIFSIPKIIVSLCSKRTQASSLKPRASKNKPIQTHFHCRLDKICGHFGAKS